MNKLTALAALALISYAPAVHAKVPAPAAEAVVAPTEAAPAEAAAVAVETKEVTLKDGTKVVIEGDMVSVVAEDGTKTAAPDGEHELADGTKVTVKEGKLVK